MKYPLKLKYKLQSLNCTGGIDNNDLRANEGRETKALNCKPNTNLKEKYELSNYYKPAVFVCTLLFLVPSTLYIKTQCMPSMLRGAGFGGVSSMNVIN